jgi:4-carboxymuconolactone decarboxylase
MNAFLDRVLDMHIRTIVATTLIALTLTASPTLAQTSASSSTRDSMTISRKGSRPLQPGPVAQFTGTARVEPLFSGTGASRTTGGSVTFEPGARSAWHTHPLGQALIVTSGTGRVQRRGGPVEELRAGDVVWTPAGVEHWHGAAPTTAMTHISIAEMLDGRNVDWRTKVTDAEYAVPPVRRAASAPNASPATAGPYADIAPALNDYTQRVLYGEVWERPGLSKRDRSLATVSALIALNRPNELPAHMKLALENGVTRDELVETITHLAFYAGWPTANTAVEVARRVFAEPAK